MYDFLFCLTEHSENEGEYFLYEGDTLKEAIAYLCDEQGFRRNEFRFIERMSVEEGEMLGLDTY